MNLLDVVKVFDQAAFNAYMSSNNISLDDVQLLINEATHAHEVMCDELDDMLEVVSYDSECNYVEYAASRYDIDKKKADISVTADVIKYAEDYYASNF